MTTFLAANERTMMGLSVHRRNCTYIVVGWVLEKLKKGYDGWIRPSKREKGIAFGNRDHKNKLKTKIHWEAEERRQSRRAVKNLERRLNRMDN